MAIHNVPPVRPAKVTGDVSSHTAHGASSQPLHMNCEACPSCIDQSRISPCRFCMGNEDGVLKSVKTCGSTPMRYYTPCQVQQHDSSNSAWLVAGDDIYDATEYISMHPGGKNSILKKAGGAVDCTEDLNFHSKAGKKIWKKYHVGKLTACPSNQVLLPAKEWWQFW